MPVRAIIGFWASPLGETNRLAYAAGVAGLAAGFLVLVISMPPAGAAIALPFLYAFACLSAKRLHDIGLSGWWAAAPFVAGGALLAAAIWFAFATTAFCQGYCAGAREGDIAAHEYLQDNGGRIWRWISAAFVLALCAVPGRRGATGRSAPSWP